MKSLLGFLVLILAGTAFADYDCHTPRMNKQFTVMADRVVFHTEDKGREIASAARVGTRFEGKGFTKVMVQGGEKVTIHIADSNQPSSMNDYLLMRSSEGHEVIYPIECKQL